MTELARSAGEDAGEPASRGSEEDGGRNRGCPDEDSRWQERLLAEQGEEQVVKACDAHQEDRATGDDQVGEPGPALPGGEVGDDDGGRGRQGGELVLPGDQEGEVGQCGGSIFVGRQAPAPSLRAVGGGRYN